MERVTKQLDPAEYERLKVMDYEQLKGEAHLKLPYQWVYGYVWCGCEISKRPDGTCWITHDVERVGCSYD